MLMGPISGKYCRTFYDPICVLFLSTRYAFKYIFKGVSHFSTSFFFEGREEKNNNVEKF